MSNFFSRTRTGMGLVLLLLLWYPIQRVQAQPLIEPGMMLVASTEVKRGVFVRSVVLLLEHGERGSVGVVLNKPREQLVGNLSQRLMQTRYGQDRLFYGGPQQRNAVFTLIRTERSHPNMRRVFGDVYAVAGLRTLLHMAEQADENEKIRVYAGFAGWAPGQLQQEVARGAWQLIPADTDTVFGDAGGLWERLSGSHIRWVGVPPSQPRWLDPGARGGA